MAEQRFGRVIARGSDSFIAMVRLALEEAREGLPLPKPLEECLTRDYVIEQHAPEDFIAKKRFVPGTQRAAYGYVVNSALLWVNEKEANEEPALGRHIIRHEIAHAMWAVYLTAAKRESIRKILRRKNGLVPASFSPGAMDGFTAYEMRGNEIIADKLAVIVSNKPSPWDGYQFFGLDILSRDYWQLIAIMFQMVAVPPPDPVITQLRAQVTQLIKQLSQVPDCSVVEAERDAAVAALATEQTENAARLLAIQNKATEIVDLATP